MLAAADGGLALAVDFLQVDDLPACEQVFDFVAGMDSQAVRCPVVALTEEVASEQATWLEGSLDTLPQFRERPVGKKAVRSWR